MAGPHENLETADHAEHAAHGGNTKIALLISVLAMFLAFSATLGKSSQTEGISANVEGSNLGPFFQATTIRMTTVTTAAETRKIDAVPLTDPKLKDDVAK